MVITNNNRELYFGDECGILRKINFEDGEVIDECNCLAEDPIVSIVSIGDKLLIAGDVLNDFNSDNSDRDLFVETKIQEYDFNQKRLSDKKIGCRGCDMSIYSMLIVNGDELLVSGYYNNGGEAVLVQISLGKNKIVRNYLGNGTGTNLFGNGEKILAMTSTVF